MHIINVVILY